MNFLIIQTAFIGDAILATSTVETIARDVPGSVIDVLVRKGNEKLLSNNPHVRRVLVWDKTQDKYKHLLRLTKKVRLRKYDAVINLQRFAATGLITAWSGAEYKIGFEANPMSSRFTHKYPHIMDKGLHEIERNAVLLGEFTDKAPAKPKLYLEDKHYEKVAKYKAHKYICVAPTSVWFTKQFPASQWINFINEVPLDYKVLILGGPDDRDACGDICAATTRPEVYNLAGRKSLLASAALMKGAVMNYVNDSAPQHLCSAVDAPVTTLFCSTIPEFGFGPLSTNSHIIQTKEKLTCRPCGLHGHKACPEDHFKCGRKIPMTELLDVLPKA